MTKGSEKGSENERQLARQLSLWLTRGTDARCLWRTIGSGGHAARFGKRQGGDITCIRPDIPLVARFSAAVHVEAKHYKVFDWFRFFVQRTGVLQGVWNHTVKLAQAEQRLPMVIARANRHPAVVLLVGRYDAMEQPAVMTLEEFFQLDPSVMVEAFENGINTAYGRKVQAAPPGRGSAGPSDLVRAGSAGEQAGSECSLPRAPEGGARVAVRVAPRKLTRN